MNNSFLFRTRQVLLTSRWSLPCTLFCLLICLKFITTLGKTFRSPPHKLFHIGCKNLTTHFLRQQMLSVIGGLKPNWPPFNILFFGIELIFKPPQQVRHFADLLYIVIALPEFIWKWACFLESSWRSKISKISTLADKGLSWPVCKGFLSIPTNG